MPTLPVLAVAAPMLLLMLMLVPSVRSADAFPRTWRSWAAGPACPQRVRRPDFVPEALMADAQLWGAVQNLVKSTLDSFEAAYASRGWNVSMALELVVGQQEALSVQRGVLSRELPYRLGSVTKVFTTLLYELAVEARVLGPQQRVEDFFNETAPPAFRPVNPFPGTHVALRHLADFTSGLAREGVGCVFVEPCKPEPSFGLINALPLTSPPGTRPTYSNLGLALLGRCVERALGNVTYEQAVVNLLSQLGLDSAGFDPSNVTMVPGTTILGSGKQVPDPYQKVNGGWVNPAGGLFLSPHDMARFMKAVLGALSGQAPNAHLSANVLRAWMQPTHMFRDEVSGFGEGAFEEFSLGNGVYAITKGGLLSGYAASMVLVPELGFGLSFQININSGIDSDVVTAQLVSKVLAPAMLVLMSQLGPLPAPPVDVTGSYGYGGNTIVTVAKIQGLPNGPQLSVRVAGGQTYGASYNAQTSPNGIVTLDYLPLQSSNSSCLNAAEAWQGSMYWQPPGLLTMPNELLYQMPRISSAK